VFDGKTIVSCRGFGQILINAKVECIESSHLIKREDDKKKREHFLALFALKK